MRMPGITVWSEPGLTADEIARAVGSHLLPHANMWQGLAGPIRAGGYSLLKTGGPMHYTLVTEGQLTDTAADHLRGHFTGPVPNPVAMPKGGLG